VLVEILIRDPPGQPFLPQTTQLAHDASEFSAGVGELVFGALRTLYHDPSENEGLQTLRERGARDARNASADIV
jgi:hypothetical protein